MDILQGTPDLARRIRWGLLNNITSGLLKEVGKPADNEDDRSELRVVATDGRVYEIVVTELED